MHSLAGRRVTVMGLGRFGGGLGVTRWLAGQGARVLVTDLDGEEKLAESVGKLRDLVDAGSVSLRLGGHAVEDFTACDLVVANPAVPRPWDNPYLKAAIGAGVPVTTEIELLIQRLPDRRRVIGITGTAGKSTTSALIAHILKECGEPVLLGGNIGGSLLGRLDGLDPKTWIVLELSSFMLHWLMVWSPHVAVVTNVMPNHTDWHGRFEHYEASKRILIEYQEAGDVAILGEHTAEWRVRSGVHRIDIPTDARVGHLAIPGAHNQRNAAAALAAVGALGIPGLSHARALAAAATFPGLPHRLQLIAEHNGVRFYNDSKSTTPEATALALRIFFEGQDERYDTPVHLIAGGYDKGSNLSPISHNAEIMAGLYTIGATGDRIADDADRAHGKGCVTRCGTLEAAVEEALRHVRPGHVVLLSPGCASWDQFTNYEERGERFAALVRARIGARGA